MPDRDPLEDIVDQLDRHHQRATYGAVAGRLGRAARSLMQGRSPSRRYSPAPQGGISSAMGAESACR